MAGAKAPGERGLAHGVGRDAVAAEHVLRQKQRARPVDVDLPQEVGEADREPDLEARVASRLIAHPEQLQSRQHQPGAGRREMLLQRRQRLGGGLLELALAGVDRSIEP